MASVLDLVKYYQNSIGKYQNDEHKILKYIDKLYNLAVTVQHLQETGVGRTVNALRKEPGDVGQAARALVCKWKTMVAAEESDQEEINNDTTNYNGNGKDYENNSSESRNKYDKHEKSHRVPKTEEKEQKSTNGDYGSKRKYQSSEEEEPEVKKSKYTSRKNNGYKIKPEIKIKSEPSESEEDSQDDSSQSDSDSEDSQSSEEEKKPNIKMEEKIIKTEKYEPSAVKHTTSSSYDKQRHNSYSENTKDNSDKHYRSSTSEIRHSSDKSSLKDKSKNSHTSRSSKENENSSGKKDRDNRSSESEKRHKSEPKSKHSDKHYSTNSSEKHKSSTSSEKHRSSSSSEKQKSGSNTEKHKSSGNSDKHRSSSNIEKQRPNTSDKHKNNSDKISDKHSSSKPDKDKHKQSSEKVISSDKCKSKEDEKRSSSSKDKHSSSSKEKPKETSSSSKEKDRSHKSDRKQSSSKETDLKMEHKKKSESSNDDKSSKKDKHKSSSSKSTSSKTKDDEPKKKLKGEDSDDGIDCGSGASFAEALGMVSPAKPKKKPTFTKDSTLSPSSNDDLSPASLLAPTAKLAPLPALEISALPEISPNYRPRPPPKFLPHFTDEDALNAGISSKNQRTKVYSGNKAIGKISTLYEMCVHVLQEHIDALEYTGGVPYDILKPVVDRATPQQLFVLEHYNAYLMEDTDHLWQKFCEKSFRSKKRQEMETWREMYIRCQEEQDIKLKSLAANIKIAQEAKKAPIKQTKMAYVDSVVKPPRNIAKRQAQHGTAFAATASPAARVASLAAAPNVLKGGRAAPAPVITSSSSFKPKKAPLMQKALQFLRGRKR